MFVLYLAVSRGPLFCHLHLFPLMLCICSYGLSVKGSSLSCDTFVCAAEEGGGREMPVN